MASKNEVVALYHDSETGGVTLSDGSNYPITGGVAHVPADAAASLCETFGFRRTKDKPVTAKNAQQSELDGLKARLAELEAASNKGGLKK